MTAAPAAGFAASSGLPPDRVAHRPVALDTGALQADAFTVDQAGSLAAYAALAVDRREELLEAETSWLRAWRADLVAADAVPLACAAAERVGVPSVVVSNFSWVRAAFLDQYIDQWKQNDEPTSQLNQTTPNQPTTHPPPSPQTLLSSTTHPQDFIYCGYLSAAGARRRPLVWRVAADYAAAARLLRLPGAVPMPAFREVVDVPLVVRMARRSPEEVRAELGLPAVSEATGAPLKVALLMYGGQPAGAHWVVEERSAPEGWAVVALGGAPGAPGAPLPPNFVVAGADCYTPDLVGACDVVLGKIGCVGWWLGARVCV